MAIIKHISIRKAPKEFLGYILNGNKNDHAKLASAINCVAEVDGAYEIMKTLYNINAPQTLIGKERENGKSSVKLHHYIQSFSPEENKNLTPEEAHKIGEEWVKKCFGEKAVAVISTHIDRGHLHNHIAILPYTLDRKHIIDNMETLEKYRSISDKICDSHGLSVIKVRKHKNTAKYKEWLERQNGTSWKSKIAEEIDRLIVDDNVHSIDDMKKQLERKGYTVRLGNYMTIKLPKMEKSIRTRRLGDGYELDDLIYRIAHKDKEISDAAIAKFSGEQKIYALYYRYMQISIFHPVQKSKPRFKYEQLRRTADILTLMNSENIYTSNDFEEKIRLNDENRRGQKREIERLKKRKKYFESQESNNNYAEEERNIDSAIEGAEILLSKYEEERARYIECYKEFLKVTQDNMYEELKKNEKERESIAEQIYSERQNSAGRNISDNPNENSTSSQSER